MHAVLADRAGAFAEEAGTLASRQEYFLLVGRGPVYLGSDQVADKLDLQHISLACVFRAQLECLFVELILNILKREVHDTVCCPCDVFNQQKGLIIDHKS